MPTNDEVNDMIKGGAGNDFYYYALEDGYVRIDDAAGTDVLVLKQILSNQVTVAMRISDGFMVVSCNGKPIAEIRGIDYMQTEDGCFRIEDWLVK
jgi:hypothetical protein